MVVLLLEEQDQTGGTRPLGFRRDAPIGSCVISVFGPEAIG
jgi:hypothetical protein